MLWKPRRILYKRIPISDSRPRSRKLKKLSLIST